jgi:DNA-binding NarL/FixJ family response regulator
MGRSARNPYCVRVWSHVAGGIGANRKVRVVAALRSDALARVLGHLLVEADDLESFVGVPPSATVLVGEISRLAPDVIVATLNYLGAEPAARIAELKAAHPASRFLLIASAEEDETSRPTGADAHILEEAVVATLVSEVRKLARGLAARAGG